MMGIQKIIKEGRKFNSLPQTSLKQYLVQHEPSDTLPRGKIFDPFRAKCGDEYIQKRNAYLQTKKQD